MKTPLLELLFPRFCVGCGYVGTYICSSCELKMKRVKKTHCFYCDKSSLFGLTHPQCKHKNGIDAHLSLYLYGGLFKKLLQESKYKGAHVVLSTLLAFPQENILYNLNKWIGLFKPLIVSIPLHPQRIKERGFNQSEIIAKKYFSGFIGTRIIDRTINTDHLANIGNKNKRRNHIRRAFTFIGNTIPKAVLLVDDVITSGSTMLECSKILKENGIQTVLAFSLAKG